MIKHCHSLQLYQSSRAELIIQLQPFALQNKIQAILRCCVVILLLLSSDKTYSCQFSRKITFSSSSGSSLSIDLENQIPTVYFYPSCSLSSSISSLSNVCENRLLWYDKQNWNLSFNYCFSGLRTRPLTFDVVGMSGEKLIEYFCICWIFE